MSNNTAQLDTHDFWAFDPATPLESPRPDRRGQNPLTLAPARTRKARSSAFYALVSLATLGIILGAQLLLSIAQADGAYKISDLQLQETNLGREERSVTQDVEKLSSPQHLSENAASLGMVVNANPAYLRLSDSVILGTVGAATTQPDTNRVANSLLDGVPLVGGGDAAAAAAASAAAEQAARDAAAATAALPAEVPTDSVSPPANKPAVPPAPAPVPAPNNGAPAVSTAQTPDKAVPLTGKLPSPVTR